MFDTIVWERKLPIPNIAKDLKIDWTKEKFQTKDFDCLMDNYKVDKNGQLWRLNRKTKWVETPDALFGGHLETVSKRWVKCKYTITIDFGCYICGSPEQDDIGIDEIASEEKINSADEYFYSLDFLAKFVDGKLTRTKLLKIDLFPIRESLLNHNKWVLERRKKEAKLSSRIKRLARKAFKAVGLDYNKHFYNQLNKFVNFQQSLVRKLF
jgi:hypothetical protein